MPPNQASNRTLIVISFRDASINSLTEYFFEMGVLKIKQISGRVSLQTGSHREELLLDESAACTAFEVLFSSSAKANRAHACLNTHTIIPNATERDLLILRPTLSEGIYASFEVGTGVRHITMFSRTCKPSRVYDTLAKLGSLSLLYPHQDLGWIVHFENEEGACEVESKLFKTYTMDSIKKPPQPTDDDPTLQCHFFLRANVVSNPSPNSISLAPIFPLLIDFLIVYIPDWVIAEWANDIWESISAYPRLRWSLLVLSLMVKLPDVKRWIRFSLARWEGQ